MGGYCKAHREIHGKDTAFKLLMVQLKPSLAIEDEVQQLRREWQERPQDGGREDLGLELELDFKRAQAFASPEQESYVHHHHYF